jgi:hypothetical protein
MRVHWTKNIELFIISNVFLISLMERQMFCNASEVFVLLHVRSIIVTGKCLQNKWRWGNNTRTMRDARPYNVFGIAVGLQNIG